MRFGDVLNNRILERKESWMSQGLKSADVTARPIGLSSMSHTRIREVSSTDDFKADFACDCKEMEDSLSGK